MAPPETVSIATAREGSKRERVSRAALYPAVRPEKMADTNSAIHDQATVAAEKTELKKREKLLTANSTILLVIRTTVVVSSTAPPKKSITVWATRTRREKIEVRPCSRSSRRSGRKSVSSHSTVLKAIATIILLR